MNQKPITAKIYKNDLTTIIQADVCDGLNKIENSSVDLIFINPPYNIGKKFGHFIEKWENEDDYIEWCYQWIDECIKS